MDRNCIRPRNDDMFHDHEVQGSVRVAGRDPHGHRFATISSQAICCDGSHYHRIETRTDFYEDHYHVINAATSLAIPVGGGRHVHYIECATSVDDGHNHKFRVAAEINDPTGDRCF